MKKEIFTLGENSYVMKQLRNEIRLSKLIAISIILSLKTAMAWYRFIVTYPIRYSYVL